MVLDLRHLLTPSAAGARLGISPTRLRALVREGRLPVAATTPFGMLFDPAAVDKLCRAAQRRWAGQEHAN